MSSQILPSPFNSESRGRSAGHLVFWLQVAGRDQASLSCGDPMVLLLVSSHLCFKGEDRQWGLSSVCLSPGGNDWDFCLPSSDMFYPQLFAQSHLSPLPAGPCSHPRPHLPQLCTFPRPPRPRLAEPCLVTGCWGSPNSFSGYSLLCLTSPGERVFNWKTEI